MTTIHYCYDCARKKGWNTSLTVTKDLTCSVCGLIKSCNELDSTSLSREKISTDKNGNLLECPSDCDFSCRGCHLETTKIESIKSFDAILKASFEEEEEDVDEIRIDLDGGKYTVILRDNGKNEALRHNESWRDLTDDSLIYHLALELHKNRRSVSKALKVVKKTLSLTTGVKSKLVE